MFREMSPMFGLLPSWSLCRACWMRIGHVETNEMTSLLRFNIQAKIYHGHLEHGIQTEHRATSSMAR